MKIWDSTCHYFLTADSQPELFYSQCGVFTQIALLIKDARLLPDHQFLQGGGLINQQ